MPNVPADLSLKVAQALSESDTPLALLCNVLGLLGNALEWDTGNIWRVDYDSVYMTSAAIWTARGKAFPNFEALSKARRFAYGEGLPGGVWKQREDVWIPHLEDAEFFPRFNIAALDGIVSAAAVPIVIQNRVVGTMEFFSSRPRPKEIAMLEAMRAAATQIGAYLERLRLEEGVTGARAEFELLAEQAFDAIVTIDENGTILFSNSALTRIFGYTREELRGRNMEELIPPQLREAHRAGMKRYLETGKRNISWDGIVLTGLHKEGLQFPVEIRFGEINQGGRRLFTGYMRPKPKL